MTHRKKAIFKAQKRDLAQLIESTKATAPYVGIAPAANIRCYSAYILAKVAVLKSYSVYALAELPYFIIAFTSCAR